MTIALKPRLFQRGPSPTTHAPITRAQEDGGGGEHTGAPPGRARTYEHRDGYQRECVADEQGEAGSVHFFGKGVGKPTSRRAVLLHRWWGSRGRTSPRGLFLYRWWGSWVGGGVISGRVSSSPRVSFLYRWWGVQRM